MLDNFLILDEDKSDAAIINMSNIEDDNELVEKNILVFDLGGGTFDVSLVNINNNES